MKNTPLKITVWPVVLAMMMLNAAIIANGQTREFPRSPLVPIFTNNPVAMLVISNLLTAPQPPLSVPVVSHTNASIGGTYWTLTSPAPLPMNPFPGLDVYQVSTNGVFIIDDRSVDYATLAAENASNNPVVFQPMGLQYDTNGLYIAVPTNSLATPDYFTVNVVNTIIGQSYDILTKPDLLFPSWMTVLTTNAASNITQVQVPRSSTNLFVWARESTGGTSFYINMPPLNQTVEDGDSVTFSVATGGNPDLTYQWTYNGVAIDGATNSSYTINNVQDSDAGQYAVTISDGTNQETTPAAQLTTDSSSPFGFTQTGNYNLIPILSQRQNYTFKSGNTYYLDSAISFYGQTTVEGGAVIKPDWYSGGSVQIMGTLDVEAEPYYPAIFTSVDDDSVGEVLGFSSQDGPPFPANNGLAFLDLTYAQGNAVVSNMQIKFADIGVTTPKATQTLDVWDSQFYECNYAVANLVNGGTNNLHNVLFADCNDAVRATTNAITINGEQITANVTRFCQSTTTPTRIALTNSLYFGTALSASSLSTVNVIRNPNGTNFVAQDYGSYYLAANSPLHHAGSAGISPRLQSELQHKTTYAPAMIAVNTTITGNMTLSPQAQRYTNGAPDLGYYYDALDYSVANFTLDGGSLTVLPDTAIAVRNDYNSTNGTYAVEGFFVREGSSIISHGTPAKPNIFTAERLVQETPETGFATYKNNNGWWFGGITFVTDSEPDDLNSPAAVYDFRFSKFYLPSSDYHFWSGYDEYGDYALEVSPDSSMYLVLQDNQFHGGRINLGNPDQGYYPATQVYPAGALSWINNSFENTAISLDPTYYRANGVVNCDMQLLAYNNLFKGGNWFLLEPFPASAGNWAFRDNLFDKVNFLQDASQPLDFDHNGYWPLLPHEFPYGGSAGELAASSGGTAGGGEVTLSNAPPYQTGTFGKFYLPVSTPLFNAGSRSPADAGLFQYTTRLDQTQEGSETGGHMVNIGLHYVAASGNVPKDADGDGVPDYVEDANGNGSVDVNETSPSNPLTDGVTNDVYNVAYDDVDLSGDGLVGRIKKALGMNPLDPSNPLTLKQIITGDEPDIATFEVPVSYDTLTNMGTLNLLVDGLSATLQECDNATNGNCLLVWNTTYEPPGQHFLQVEFSLNGFQDETSVDSGVGNIVAFNSSNMVQFFESSSAFDDNGAVLYATTPACLDADYTIELKTLSGAHIKTIAGTTSTGVIQENWDLKDDNGNIITNESVNAVYSVTLLDPGSGTNTQRLNKTSGVTDGNFDVAYAYNSSPLLRKDGVFWNEMQGVVDVLQAPDYGFDVYNSTFNIFTYNLFQTYPGYLADRTAATNLLNNLGDSATRNFYFFGHGSTTYLGDGNSNSLSAAYLYIGEVAARFINSWSPKTGITARHPYRFVFLDGCETAKDKNWQHVFGIYERSKTGQPQTSIGPQAFLGWEGVVGGIRDTNDVVNADLAQAYGETLNRFFLDWMSGEPLAVCKADASSKSRAMPFPIRGNEKITVNGTTWTRATANLKIAGYLGLKRDGVDGSYP